MASILILGGTAWLGRTIATLGVAAGHEVTCAARGQSGEAPPGARFVAIDRTVPGTLDALAREQWDHVVELAWDPVVVQAGLEALAERAAHWTLVSSISVYDGDAGVGADETQALVEPDPAGDYGAQKAHAEAMSAAAVRDRLLIVRPGLIVGAGDPSDRFSYWPSRFALAADIGGAVLMPPVSDMNGDAWAQVIEADDLAAFILQAAMDARSGPVDATGLPVPLAEVLDTAATAAGFDGARHSPGAAWLLEHDVQYWAGPRSLPLWLPPEMPGFARRDTGRFEAWKGTTRPLTETIARALADERARGVDRERHAGLTRAEERALLAKLRG